MKYPVFAIAIVLMLQALPSKAMPGLCTDGSKLTNLNVNGTLYDVTFQDGVADVVYAGVDINAPGYFDLAAAVSAALVEFFNGPPAFAPSAPAGCNSPDNCLLFVPDEVNISTGQYFDSRYARGVSSTAPTWSINPSQTISVAGLYDSTAEPTRTFVTFEPSKFMPTLCADGSELMNLDVNGALYNVTFQDGVAGDVYAGVDINAPGYFNLAAAVSAALVEFFNGPPAFAPNTPVGCTSPDNCLLFVPDEVNESTGQYFDSRYARGLSGTVPTWSINPSQSVSVNELYDSTAEPTRTFVTFEPGNSIVLDQAIEPAPLGASAIYPSQVPAQTFTVGEQGMLAYLSLPLTRYEESVDNDVMVSIYHVADSAPYDSGPPLFTITIPSASLPVWAGTSTVLFSSLDVSSAEIMVASGDELAIVAECPDCTAAPSEWVVWHSGTSPGYDGGSKFINEYGNGFVDFGGDQIARTYVDTSITLDQAIEPDPLGGSAIYPSQVPAQTFTIGGQGKLAYLSLPLTRYEESVDNDVVVSIYPVLNSAPDDSASPLFSTTIPSPSLPLWAGTSNVLFSSIAVSSAEIMVASGDELAIVAECPDCTAAPSEWVVWQSGTSPGYDGGSKFINEYGNGFVDFGGDQIARVWVSNLLPSDVDGDGVPDVEDPCPSDPADDCDPSGSAAEEITSTDGGTVSTPDGQLTLDVDAGDLAEDETLSVTEIVDEQALADVLISDGAGQPLALYVLEPDGTEFAQAITLTIDLDVSALSPEARDNLDIYLYEDTDEDSIPDEFVPQLATCVVTQDPIDTFIASCTLELLHFSTYAVVAPQDSDGDGVFDDFGGISDTCPLEDATGFDVDADGCIDTIGGLAELVSTLVQADVIDSNMENSLLSKLANVQNSLDKNNICAMVGQLDAFKLQVAAQSGKKISAAVSGTITDYADSAIAFVILGLPEGEICG